MFGVHSKTNTEKLLQLVLAGGKETPFTEDAYKELFVASKGLPRDAIKMADESLRLLYLTQQQKADGPLIQQIAKELNLAT